MGKREVILERAQRLRGFPGQKLPPGDDETIEKAERIAGGTVFFYENTPVEVGLENIDWSGSHLEHQEWPAQLNRFYILGPLAAAWQATRDDRFPSAARSYVEDWIDRHEPTGELNLRDNTLNMSLRLGSSRHSGWGAPLPAFLDSPRFDDEFLEKVLSSVAGQAGFLSRNLSPRGNWRISELDALVFTALRFPFLENAEDVLDVGIRGMRNALATQFLPDGVHVECTPGYHAWMASVLSDYFRLAGIFPEADAGVTRERLRGPLDYMMHSVLSGFNDATAPFAEAEISRGLKERRTIFPNEEPPLEQVFADAGQVFLRDSWEPGADYLAFDAGSWGGAHSHLSRLSFVYRSRGRMLVADPGILTYEMSDPMGLYGKSTSAHTTLNVNGGNQSEADARLLRTEFTPEVALIQAKYAGGYWTGEYGWRFRDGHGAGAFGIHERILFRVKGEYILVLDRMETDEDAEIRNCWQLGPMDAWKADAEQLTWRSKNESVNLLLKMVMSPEGTGMECFEGSADPIRGWVGDADNRPAHVAAPLVEFLYPGSEFPGCVSAALVVPFEGDEPPAYAVTETHRSARGRLSRITLALPDGSTDTIAWTCDLELPVEEPGRLATDATFAWCRRDGNGNVTRHFLLDGTHLEVDGNAVNP